MNDSELQELHQVHTEAYAQMTVALANARWELKEKNRLLLDAQEQIKMLKQQLTRIPSQGEVIDGNVAS